MKNASFTIVSTLVVVGLTLASGMIHGSLTNRWGPPPAMVAAARKLEGVPTQFGHWQMERELEMDETTKNMLELAGWINRSYVNQSTGQIVHVSVLLGPAGRISVHTPEICMPSRKYVQNDRRKRIPIPTAVSPQSSTEDSDGIASKNSVDVPENSLWGLTFQSREASGELLRVYYGWSRGGPWAATGGPRYEYAGSPYLYKIQLAAAVPPLTLSEETDPCQEFLTEFFPALQPWLMQP